MQLQFAARCDAVVVLAGGRVVQQGKYEELLLQGDGEFAAMMRDYIAEDQKNAIDDEGGVPHERMSKPSDAPNGSSSRSGAGGLNGAVTARYQLVKQEEVALGAIAGGVWRSWAAGLGPLVWLVVALALCTFCSCASCQMLML